MKDDPKTKAQMEGLAILLVLNDEVKKVANLREFGFFTTNETHRLIPYHTAFLWQKKEFTGAVILAQSGTAELDTHAPVNQWVKSIIDALVLMPEAKKIHTFDLNDNEVGIDHLIFTEADEWTNVLPSHVLWCPLLNKEHVITGGLLLFREQEFTSAEIKMITWLIASYQYTWQILTRPKLTSKIKNIRIKQLYFGIGTLVLLTLLFPIRLSVLGNATVVPKDPELINAPMQGVIKSFAVVPGQKVKRGQILLTIDKTDLLSEAEVRQKEYQLTETKLRTAINEGFDNTESRTEIPILQAQLKIDKARIDYTNTLLKKTEVISPIDGIVVFDSKEDWVGQPVQTGERILSVADPSNVKLKIMIPITNIISIKNDADGEFFLYGQLSSLPFKIVTLGYNAKLLPNRILSYQLEGLFTNPNDKPQLGAEGTARVYGSRVPLIYYLALKPLQAIRQTIGL